LLEKIKEYGMEIFCLVFLFVTMVVVLGVFLGNWSKAFLFIGAFPVLAVGAFAVLYFGFLVIALIYGGILYILGRDAKLKWWD